MGRKAKSADSGEVLVRLLCDSQFGASDDVVSLPVELAQHAQALGLADSDPTAVAYAQALNEGA